MASTHRPVLIETKLEPPSAVTRPLPRPQLLGRLEANGPVRLVAVVAPAGYGKTTLLEAWIRSLGRSASVGWLSLDERDADPVVFVSYVAECVRRLGAAIDSRLLDEMTDNPAARVELVAHLAAELARLEGRQILVVDNLHRVGNAGAMNLLLDLIEALPPTATIAAATRASLPQPLQRLQEEGEAIVLTAADLAFTPDETSQLFAAIGSDLEHAPASIARVHELAEGWPVVVDLAARQITGHDEPQRAIEAFDGMSQVVVGYVVEEILDELGPEQLDFVLDMSVVDRFSIDLAEAMTGRPARGPTDQLIEEHLFFDPVDHRTWYVPHPVVRNLLHAKLVSDDPDRARHLEAVAGRWYRQGGNTPEAIEHLTRAREFDEALALIGDVLRPYGAAGQSATILRWLDRFPVEEIDRRPEAASRLAYALTMLGRFDEASGWLDRAVRSATDDAQLVEVLSTKLYLDRARGDADAVLRLVDTLRELEARTTDQRLPSQLGANEADLLAFEAISHDFVGNDEARRDAARRLEAQPSEPTVARGHRAISARFAAGITDREMTVIRYLPTRMTNREIATEIGVSRNTVKSHLRAIYRKLGVTSRNEAIERSRALDLL